MKQRNSKMLWDFFFIVMLCIIFCLILIAMRQPLKKETYLQTEIASKAFSDYDLQVEEKSKAEESDKIRRRSGQASW